MRARAWGLWTAALLIAAPAWGQNARETAVRQDLEQFRQDTSWLYNDLDEARAVAREEGKPVLVLVRCVP